MGGISPTNTLFLIRVILPVPQVLKTCQIVRKSSISPLIRRNKKKVYIVLKIKFR
jgi:hypothetical protein